MVKRTAVWMAGVQILPDRADPPLAFLARIARLRATPDGRQHGRRALKDRFPLNNGQADSEAAGPVVLIVAPQPFYEDRGTPIATRQLATALAALGFRVHLLAYPLGADLDIPNVTVVRSANPFGVRRVPIGFSVRKLALDVGMLATFRRLRRTQRYAVIHAVEEMAFAAVAWSYGCPVIYDMQSSLPDQLRSHAIFRARPVQSLCRRLERWLVMRATAIVCSAGLKYHVQALSPRAIVTEMMYLSAADRPDPRRAAELRARIGIADGARVVLYSGTFEPYQGLDLLVAAMAAVLQAHPEVVFVLVGATGSPPLADNPVVRSLRDAHRLHILGRQEREMIPHYLAMADVLVSPRCYGDNVPLKIFDYMAAGKPIVATDIKAHRSLLDAACAAMVEVSARGLAAGINRVLEDPVAAARLAERALLRSGRGSGVERFEQLVESVYGRVCGLPVIAAPVASPAVVSVVIPARNAAALIADVVGAVRRQEVARTAVEIIVVDDGSTDDTVARARSAGAQVIESRPPGAAGNPAEARNRGASAARGDPLVFLDADCVVAAGWLAAILEAHRRGATVVGGSLALPRGLSATARCDYYCGWYLTHPRIRAGWVPHHPPPNLSVRRQAFFSTPGFSTQPPLDYTNEERLWQGQLRAAGHRIWFEPRAVAEHYNRPGFGNLLRRHYPWGYTAVEAKSRSGAARLAWLYRHPWWLLAASPGLVVAHTVMILWCWLRAGVFEVLWMSPAILASRVTYVAGLCTGALRWLRSGRDAPDTPPLSARHDVVVLRTEPLAEDVEVTGRLIVKLWASSDGPDTDFTMKLVDTASCSMKTGAGGPRRTRSRWTPRGHRTSSSRSTGHRRAIARTAAAIPHCRLIRSSTGRVRPAICRPPKACIESAPAAGVVQW